MKEVVGNTALGTRVNKERESFEHKWFLRGLRLIHCLEVPRG
jgi:hypothetical protein